MLKKVILIVALVFFGFSAARSQWTKQSVNTTASFRGLSVVNEKVVWASGTGGTVIRTVDGGKTWSVMTVPGAEKLDFRDIEAFDVNTAFILSIGNGENSRIYKTINGGKTWKEEFRNKNEKAFYDALDCFNKIHCTALSDPVDGKFVITKTGPAMPGTMPPAIDGEAAFAASGTCLIKQGDMLFFVSGGNAARVFRSVDRGYNWEVFDTPLIKGTAGSGIFSIAMSDAKHGVIVGGNYEKPDEARDNLALTSDGGATWKLGPGLSGFRSAVTYIDAKTIIAVGTNGADVSRDSGKAWIRVDDANYNTVAAKTNRAIWAAGPAGYVAKLDWREFLKINGYKPCPTKMICDPPSIAELRVSHNEIDSTCVQANTHCSNKRQIDIVAVAVDVPRNWYDYTVSGGRVTGMGPNVIWDLSDVKPGAYTLTAGIKFPFRNTYGFMKTITKEAEVK